jgi:hypothetical protein
MSAARSTAGLLVAVALLFAATSASASTRGCGAVGKGSSRVAVYVTHGKVSCATARRVMRALLRGDGVYHQGSSRADSYTQLGRWRCGSGTGGGGCVRAHPHQSQRIGWGYCGEPGTEDVCKT